MTTTIRLSKAVAELAQCSRRQAESLIASGQVTVAGQVLEKPEHRVPSPPPAGLIHVKTGAQAQEPPSATVLLHKPSGATAWDEQWANEVWLHAQYRSPADRSGVPLLRKHLKNMVCVTPLEPAATGLVVFTQDIRIQRKLMADGALLENEVMVEVKGPLDDERIDALSINRPKRGSVLLFGGAPIKVSLTATTDHSTVLRFALKGYVPGDIADHCRAHQLELLAIKRQRLGRVALSGLAAGQWRFLMPYERF